LWTIVRENDQVFSRPSSFRRLAHLEWEARIKEQLLDLLLLHFGHVVSAGRIAMFLVGNRLNGASLTPHGSLQHFLQHLVIFRKTSFVEKENTVWPVGVVHNDSRVVLPPLSLFGELLGACFPHLALYVAHLGQHSRL
jgi:hypothetical protein